MNLVETGGIKKRASLLLSAALVCASMAHGHTEQQDISWQVVGNDLQQASARLNPESVFSSSIVMVRTSLRTSRIQVIRAADYGWKRATVRALCRAAGASACINTNFFDEQGKALGLVLSRGIIHQKIHRGGGTLTGIFFATPKSVGISPREGFSPDGVVEASQAGPRVLSSGVAVPGLKESSFRTNLSGVCIDRQKRVVLYRVTSGVFGASLPLLQSLLMSPGVECEEALNFDGGGSSQLYISGSIPGHNGAVREESFPGRDEVPVALGIFTIDQTPPSSDIPSQP